MSKTTGLLIILAILVLGAAAYLMFVAPQGSAISAVGAPATVAETQFLGLAAQIGPVTFDTSIFDDARFKGLQDLRTAIIPETAGRADPFAPL